MEEDALLLRRELGKTDIDVCELCGRPVQIGALDNVEPAAVRADDESVRVCPMCKQELASGSLPLDAISGDAEDDILE